MLLMIWFVLHNSVTVQTLLNWH